MVDRLKQIVHDTDAWIIRHKWSRVTRRAVIGFMQHNALHNAGSMAYFAVLSIFQLLVLGVVVMSFFLGEGEARQFIVEQVEAGTPMEPDTVTSIIDGVIESRGGISLFSGIFLLWGALGMFSALNRGIASAFVRTEPRPFIKDKLVGLSLIAVVGILGVLSIVIGIVTGILQQTADDVLGGIPGRDVVLWLVGFTFPILLIFLAFLAIYRITPNRSVSIKEVWPGALVATILWSILRIGFTYYATNLANYDSAFGPISTGITLLVFLYFASVVVLLGAEVARANVLDAEVPAPRPVLAGPLEGARTPADVAAARDDSPQPEAGRTRPLPGWSLAIGGAVAGAVLRRISRRGSGRWD